MPGTEDYICAVNPDLYINSYIDWAVTQPLLYGRNFAAAADGCLALLGMTKRDLTVKNACLIYKYLLALTD
jgi:hypothetical protein